MSNTIVTPSGKSHERVTGRWTRDITIQNKRDWFLYYVKHVAGTPIPILFGALGCLSFVSNPALSVASFVCFVLTATYIVADRISKQNEFEHFRIGADLFLWLYLGFSLFSFSLRADFSLASWHNWIQGIQWLIAMYTYTYCWQLFPGLNRMFYLFVGVGIASAIYGVWQHFTGIDPFHSANLHLSEIGSGYYFKVSGLIQRPEVFATMLATLLPLPVAAFLIDGRRLERLSKTLAMAIVLALSIAIFWTYETGIWIAASTGILMTLVIVAQNYFKFVGILILFLALVVSIFYSSPQEFWGQVQSQNLKRTAEQRVFSQSDIRTWKENIWFGSGLHRPAVIDDSASLLSSSGAIDSSTASASASLAATSVAATARDSFTGNTYFRILAEFGVLGLGSYLLFILGFILATYRILQEIPTSHFWHRVLVSGGLGSQIAFHSAGLYWSTLTFNGNTNLFFLLLAALAYLTEHYSQGIVADDYSL